MIFLFMNGLYFYICLMNTILPRSSIMVCFYKPPFFQFLCLLPYLAFLHILLFSLFLWCCIRMSHERSIYVYHFRYMHFQNSMQYEITQRFDFSYLTGSHRFRFKKTLLSQTVAMSAFQVSDWQAPTSYLL